MAADFIHIARDQSAATEAAELLQTIRDLRSVYERLARIVGKMNHNFADPDFSALETLWGIPAGSGQTVFNLVNGSRGAMNGEFQNNNVIELTERVG